MSLDKKNIQDLAQEISSEVERLTEGREKIRQIRDELMAAGYKEAAACKRIAEAIPIDYRTLQKWLEADATISTKKFLEMLIFIDAYIDFKKEIKNGETK